MTPPNPPKRPPKKRPGQGRGRRRFDGLAWDIATGAQQIGLTEKALRSQIARGLWPHHRLAGRIILIADEVREFLRKLPGTSAAEALENVAERNGEGG